MNEPTPTKRNRANTVMMVIGTIAACCGVAAVHQIVPKFREVFVSFGADLPLFTRLFTDYRHVLWVLPLAVPVVAACVRVRDPTDVRRGATALLLGLAMAIGLPLVCGFAMYLPIYKLAAVVG
jgi:type II secretory pathway component PulF